MTPKAEAGSPLPHITNPSDSDNANGHRRSENSIDKIPLLDSQSQGSTGGDGAAVQENCESKVMCGPSRQA